MRLDKRFSVTKKIFFSYLYLPLILLITCFVHAESFQLKNTAPLNGSSGLKRNWLTPIPHPSNSNKTFVAATNGEIFLVENNKLTQSPLIDFAKLSKRAKLTKLSAITLHPNYSLKGLDGENIIYAASIQAFNDNGTKRLYTGKATADFKFDAVITEITVNKSTKRASSRELLRLAVPNTELSIASLSFNPHISPWQENYGLLYIALPTLDSLGELPIYSGAIMRIIPNKYGLRSYTIPATNPFSNNADVADELVVIGAGKIHSLNWFKSSSDEIIISHQYLGKTQVSLVKHGKNIAKTKPAHILYSNDENFILQPQLYKGRLFEQLSNKLVFLHNDKKQWQLHTIEPGEQKATVAWSISPYQIPSPNNAALYQQFNDELAIIDKSDDILFDVSNVNLPSPTDTSNDSQEQTNTTNNQDTSPLYMLIGLIALVGITIVLLPKRFTLTLRALFKPNYLHFVVNKQTQQISCFKRHHNDADLTLATENIQQLSITLNKRKLLTVSKSAPELAFTTQHEAMLRSAFANEYQQKMVSKRVRKIDLIIQDANNHHHFITAYHRRGSQRLTRSQYGAVIEQIIDLCRLLSDSHH